MATYLSDILANLANEPQTMNPAGKHGGRVRTSIATITDGGGTAFATSDVIQLTRIPSSAIINGISAKNESMGTVFTGAFQLSQDDPDFTPAAFGNSADLAVASDAWVDLEAPDASEAGKPLWEIAGLDSDPGVDFIVEILLAVTTPVASAVANIKVNYVS